MDKIAIEDLRVDAIIGAYDWERKILQELIFDIEIESDISQAGKSDDLTDVSIDYGQLAQYVREFVSQSSFNLLEALLENLAQGIHEKFDVKKLEIKVSKPRPDDGFVASIKIKREF